MADPTAPRLEGIVCAVRHLLWRLAEGMSEDGDDVPERLRSAAALALERFEEPGVPWAENSPCMTAEGEQAAAEWMRWLREADAEGEQAAFWRCPCGAGLDNPGWDRLCGRCQEEEDHDPDSAWWLPEAGEE